MDGFPLWRFGDHALALDAVSVSPPTPSLRGAKSDEAIQTLRHSGMVRRTRPGISRFRVRCFASPRNDDGASDLFQFTINRIIGIADLLAAVKSRPVVGRQWETQLQPARQVGIGNE